jgi:hypothetical protein
MKIKIHSLVDLITNSSTTVYSYSNNSLIILKELVNEFFKSMGLDKKYSDVFDMLVALDEEYAYHEYIDEHENAPDHFNEKYLAADYKGQGQMILNLIKEVASGKIEGNEWFVEMNKELINKENYIGLTPSTALYIFAKESKFDKLAELFSKFLYSVDNEGAYEG